MKMIKGLTKANIRGTGIEAAPKYDFKDDGNTFRGFSYRDIPITQCRAGGRCYLDIRVDKLEREFTYDEWLETPEAKLAYEFSDVVEFDLEKLIEILNTIISKVDELDEWAKANAVDISPVRYRLSDEIAYNNTILERFRNEFKWYEVGLDDLSILSRCYHKLNEKVQECNKLLEDINGLSRSDKMVYLSRYDRAGYIIIPNDYHIRERLLEWLDK